MILTTRAFIAYGATLALDNIKKSFTDRGQFSSQDSAITIVIAASEPQSTYQRWIASQACNDDK